MTLTFHHPFINKVILVCSRYRITCLHLDMKIEIDVYIFRTQTHFPFLEKKVIDLKICTCIFGLSMQLGRLISVVHSAYRWITDSCMYVWRICVPGMLNSMYIWMFKKTQREENYRIIYINVLHTKDKAMNNHLSRMNQIHGHFQQSFCLCKVKM